MNIKYQTLFGYIRTPHKMQNKFDIPIDTIEEILSFYNPI